MPFEENQWLKPLKQGLKYIRNNPRKILSILPVGAGYREPMHKQYARQWAEMFADDNNN